MSYATVDQLTVQLKADGVTALLSDDTLQELLDQASADVDSFCRRDFLLHENDSLTVRAKGQDFLLLPGYPLLSVAGLSIDGAEKAVQDPPPAHVPGLAVWACGKISGVFLPLGSTVVVQYTWGYNEPPAPVVKATLRLASRKWRHGKVRDRIAEGVRSESIEGYSISVDPLEMDRDVAVLLQDLRKKRAAR